MPKDLRTFIDQVARAMPTEIHTVSQEVDPRWGATAVAARLEQQQRFPTLVFRRVRGSRLPVVLNLTATYERLALAIDSTPREMVREYGQRQARPIPPVWVDSGPVHDVALTGADAQLSVLPILTHNELDAGPFVAGGCLVAKDPDSGEVNVGLYRHQVLGPQRLGVFFNPGHHGDYLRQRYEELGKPMEVAIAIGHHPGFMMGAVSRLPGIGQEFAEAGALIGEPVELVRAKTVDLPVPARAEIVIEGVIPPGARAFEGPFGEWPGHYTAEGDKPFIDVQAITMRRDAIYYDVVAAHREHVVLGSLPRMGSVFRRVKQVVPGVRQVNVPAHSRMHCYISIKKTSDAEVGRAGYAALLTEPENFRMIVVVDDDIDVFNDGEVLWAIGTRFHADTDLVMAPNIGGAGGLSPVGYNFGPNGQKTPRPSMAIIVDATKPAPPADYPPRAVVPAAAIEQVDLDALLEPFTADSLSLVMSHE
ncbi:MAG TPA: UbiD family decarboxylase [Chloroflexota bacterium]|nr:UbiD family decarboxylase [Chloroflexota bacterium]